MPSTVIRAHSYDSQNRELTIIFVSGRRYVYAGVPQQIATALGQAPSRGAYFNQHIRDHFAYRELETAGARRR